MSKFEEQWKLEGDIKLFAEAKAKTKQKLWNVLVTTEMGKN